MNTQNHPKKTAVIIGSKKLIGGDIVNTRELKNILEERKSKLRIEIAEEKVKTFKDPLEVMEKQMRLVELNSVLHIIEHAVAPDLRKETKTLEQMKSYIINSMRDQMKQNVASELQNQGK